MNARRHLPSLSPPNVPIRLRYTYSPRDTSIPGWGVRDKRSATGGPCLTPKQRTPARRGKCRKEESDGRLAAGAAGGRADALAGANLDAGFRVARRRGAHALLDLARHGEERLLDIAGVLRRGLEEGDAEAVGEFLFCVSGAALSCVTPQPGHPDAASKEMKARSGKGRGCSAVPGYHTFATVYSTTFLSAMSLLLPTSSLLTPSVA